MKIKEEQGDEAYFESIQNTIAGCRQKWKTLPKVRVSFCENVVFYLYLFVRKLKQNLQKELKLMALLLMKLSQARILILYLS